MQAFDGVCCAAVALKGFFYAATAVGTSPCLRNALPLPPSARRNPVRRLRQLFKLKLLSSVSAGRLAFGCTRARPGPFAQVVHLTNRARDLLLVFFFLPSFPSPFPF